MIGYVGLSHLGIVSSIITASKGYGVTAYDPNSGLCKALGNGNLPIFEPGLAEFLEACRCHIRFSDDVDVLKECSLIFISEDVPTDKDNRSDLSSIHRLMEKVISHVLPNTTLVVLSQVPPGFTRRLARELELQHRNRGLQLFYQVETLVFGCAVERALNPERFIVGCNDPMVALPRAYFEWLKKWNCPILLMRYESAELAKISINLYLAASIGITNTLSDLCEAIGADWSEIVPALKSDRRIGPHAYLRPGLGIGGGNIERDLATVKSLALEQGVDDGFLPSLVARSSNRIEWVVKALRTHVLSRYKNPTLAIWGLSYKPGTKSTKNSPVLELLESLKGLPIRIYDPQAVLSEGCYPWVTQVSSPLNACEGACVLIIMTAWEEFAAIPPAALHGLMCGQVVVDPAGAWDRQKANEAGFLYCGLGAPASEPKAS